MRHAIRGTATLLALFCALATLPSSEAQEASSAVRLPDETVGLDNIARTLIATFDQVDVLALSDAHGMTINSAVRLAVVRHPAFARQVRFIVVEFGNTADQSILDRYIRGENVSHATLRQVWHNTCCGETWDAPMYAEFLDAVRDVNRRLPPAQKIRVIGGDPPAGTPPQERDRSAASVLRETVLGHGKALVIYGGGHLFRGGAIATTVRDLRLHEMFVVDTYGGDDPDFVQFDHALKSAERPILFSVMRPPFIDMRADFLGRGTKALVNGVWVDVNPAEGRKLGQASYADAFVYFGHQPLK